jgi:hypothetical protein
MSHRAVTSRVFLRRTSGHLIVSSPSRDRFYGSLRETPPFALSRRGPARRDGLVSLGPR